jgi:hypothetical protein
LQKEIIASPDGIVNSDFATIAKRKWTGLGQSKSLTSPETMDGYPLANGRRGLALHEHIRERSGSD